MVDTNYSTDVWSLRENIRWPRPDTLPRPVGAIAKLARIIGPEAALTLAEKRGGTAVYISSGFVKSESVLTGLIGAEAAQKLVAAAGVDIEVNGRAMLKVPLARAWRVAVYIAAGWSYAEVALAVCIDENTVHGLLKDLGVTGAPRKGAAVRNLGKRLDKKGRLRPSEP